MKFKAIIFDMDGTIVDTEQLWLETSHTLITNRGKKLTPQEKEQLNQQLHGSGFPKACQLIKDITQSDEDLEVIMKEKLAIGRKLYEKGICFIQGFPEFIQKVTSYELKVAVATNATTEIIEITDKILNLSQYFGKHLYSRNHVNNISKPSPVLFFHAAQQLGVNPRECIVIEDSAHGIMAAKAAGMFCIGINTSKQPDQIKHADLQIDRYQDINLQKLLI
jgi:beta-phosphoglucomutase